MSSNARSHRVSRRPSKIEETAMLINDMMNIESRNDCNGISTGSVFTPTGFTVSEEDRRHLTEDGAASRNTEPRSLTSISFLQEVRRSGISDVNRPDEWIALDVTVDSGSTTQKSIVAFAQ